MMLKKGADRLCLSVTFLLLMPLLGVISSRYDYRQLLLVILLILAMTVFVVLVQRSQRSSRSKDHVLMILIFTTGLTLLLAQSLISDALLGWDIHYEYNVFSQVLAKGIWRPDVYLPYNSVLSVSILPVVLTSVSDIDGITIFKIIFPLMFSIAPVLLYSLYKKILVPEAAFLAVFFFVAYRSFYVELIGLARQEVAEILLLVLLLLLFSPRSTQRWSTLAAIFALTLGIVTAHYSIAYVYLIVLLCSFLLSHIFKRRIPELINSSILALTVMILVVWYAFVANGLEVATFVRFLSNITLQDLFSLSARPTIMSAALGVGAFPGVLHDLNRIVYYLVNISLVLGFFVFILKRKKTDSERKMVPVMVSGMFLIGSAVLVPNFYVGLNITRLYHLALLLASPCFVYGAGFLSSNMRRLISAFRIDFVRFPSGVSSKWLLAASILFLFLLFDSGWVWAVSMDRPTSILLDHERMLTYPDPDSSLRDAYLSYYTAPQDIAAAVWLRPILTNGGHVCADSISAAEVLASYGGVRPYSGSVLVSDLLYDCDFQTGYVYFSLLNTVYGVGDFHSINTYPISDISPELYLKNLAYSNGGATIYASPA
jgi:uncharacterized membrane protein